MPPLAKPEKAAWDGSGVQSATNAPVLGKLLRWRPTEFFGPHPKQKLFGEYRSCNAFFVFKTAPESEHFGAQSQLRICRISACRGTKSSKGGHTNHARSSISNLKNVQPVDAEQIDDFSR